MGLNKRIKPGVTKNQIKKENQKPIKKIAVKENCLDKGVYEPSWFFNNQEVPI